MANIFKKQNSPQICDGWRGIFINSHVGNILAGLLYDALESSFVKLVGSTQIGGAPGVGMAPATHVVRIFLDVARLKNMSVMVLFVDLSKAFDYLIRELVLGWPAHIGPAERRRYLAKVGVPEQQVDAMLNLIDCQPSAFAAAGVPQYVRALLLSLHTGAWFQIGSIRVVTRRGGRHGVQAWNHPF